MDLWRAAHDDGISDTISFARRREDAERYRDNPGFGGPTLYRATVCPAPSEVLDLWGMGQAQALRALERATGLRGLSDQGETADGLVCSSVRVQDALVEHGLRWVRVEDTYPAGCETWTYISRSDRDDPTMDLAEEDRS